MNAIITVIGKDKKGIIYGVSSVLSKNNINKGRKFMIK